MLVLTRKVGESVVVPGLCIEFKLLGIKGNVVKVGIEAPPAVLVLRKEKLPPADARSS
jgi:carbon storage regulator CsrA